MLINNGPDSKTFTDKVLLANTRHVRTAQGQKKYGEPIGSPIVKDIKKLLIHQHGISDAEGAKKFERELYHLRRALSKPKPEIPVIHNKLISVSKILKKYNGDEQTTKYVQFLLRKFFPNLPSPARHLIRATPLKKLKKS